VPTVSLGDLEEDDAVVPPEHLEPDDVLVEGTHHGEISHADRHLGESLDPAIGSVHLHSPSATRGAREPVRCARSEGCAPETQVLLGGALEVDGLDCCHGSGDSNHGERRETRRAERRQPGPRCDDRAVTRSDLPTGTVTFLFTDVEGSTRLLHEHGAGYADLLAEHRRVLRDAFATHAGVEVDTQGDAFFVAFARATDAVAAADEARHALDRTGPVRVRIGIHTGEPLVTDEGYVGVDVHRAARIAAAAHGSQIVLSEATRQLVDDDRLVDLGEHRLKDLVQAERLYQLGEGSFPPLRTLDATNLPVASSGLVGRESELAELVAALSSGTRLLTITGPGGTGKTRLALQAAAELVGRLRDGVFWVPLGGLSAPALVTAEVAQTIGAPDDLASFLRGRELLLLLDNFEHLLGAATAVSSLLASSSDVRILVTSRAPLRVSGEREYRLEPLPVGDASTLFVERARAAGKELEPDATIEAICRRLDGLPLAIELAAARMRLLGPEALLERLDSALPLLTGGARDAPERQRTLRATIEWSYDLLEPPAQRSFARLAVFAGSFPLGAAEAVCDVDLEALTSLVELSLVKPIGEDRFLMLETIREYAQERLEDSTEAGDVRDRHATYFARLGETAYERRFAAEAEWSARLEVDQDDMRAALDWLAADDADRALELAGALGWYWLSRGLLEEGSGRLSDALAASAGSATAQARALTALGALTARRGDVEGGLARLEEAVELWREVGEPAELAAALDSLGWPRVYDAGDDDGALRAFEEAMDIWRELGDSAGETRALVGVCQVLVARSEVERAETLSHELLARAGDDLRTEHFAYHFLADCALIRGDTRAAETRYRQSLKAALPLGDVIETSFEVQGVAMAVAGSGDPGGGLRLAAAVEALWESLGISVSIPFWDALLERYLSPAREQLHERLDEIWAEGRALPFEDAVQLAAAATETHELVDAS
jgi:predicted ATPase/class 3 adenylate cyclase